jgi:hypothetical protein
LRELNKRPGLGPERIDRVEIEAEQESPPTPDEWSDQKTNGKTSSKTRTTTLTSPAQRDHWLRKLSTAAITTTCSGARVIPSPHSTSHLSPLLNDSPIPDTATTTPRLTKPIRHDPILSTS